VRVMSELKLPTINPSMPHIMANESGEDWSSWNNGVMSFVSVEINTRSCYVGMDLPTISPRIGRTPTNAA
jgi:hypothetical protein